MLLKYRKISHTKGVFIDSGRRGHVAYAGFCAKSFSVLECSYWYISWRRRRLRNKALNHFHLQYELTDLSGRVLEFQEIAIDNQLLLVTVNGELQSIYTARRYYV